ncbi:MAG: glutamate racemase, partial [Gemmatimonadales bacterium]|nr:glutamate racemase [Gemmatimonadales bacterium]
MNAAPIGIFDSGLGGLTVAHAIFEHFPNDSTVYVGDTARVPYGPKSADTVRRYSLEILAWLLHQRVKAVVVACNTSTAQALEALEAASPVPVLG